MEWVIGLGLLGALLLGGYLVWANLPTFRLAWPFPLLNDADGWEGATLVQRFDPGSFAASGNQVRLTLRASSTRDAWITSIWISQPAAAGDPWDAGTDLKQFYGKARVRANTSLTLSDTLPDVQYDLDSGNTLLIAVDFERGAPSGIRYTAGTVAQLGNLTAYWLPPAEGGGSEAGKDNRSPGYRRSRFK
jgi:hypothetical protein